MNCVEDLAWSVGDTAVTWRVGSTKVRKEYNGEVGTAVALQDKTGVAVVEPDQGIGSLNAVMFNADGSERFRVSPPLPSDHVSFYQMYYIGDELTAIATTRGNDWAAVVDPSTGLNLRNYETR